MLAHRYSAVACAAYAATVRGAAAVLRPTDSAHSVHLAQRRVQGVWAATGRVLPSSPRWTRALSGAAGDEVGIVKVEVADGVATLTLNDNKKRNALSSTMMATLRDTIKALEVYDIGCV
jgi:hypothetical protein